MLGEDSELTVPLGIRPHECARDLVFRFRADFASKAWLEPLIEAAAQHGISNSWSPGKITTKWDPSLPENEAEADEEKQTVYATHMAAVIGERMPPLLALINAAGATLLVAPGSCMFTVPTRIGEVFDIDELKPDTLLVPWIEDDEAAQPQ